MVIVVLVGVVSLAAVLPASRAASRSRQASASNCGGGSESIIRLTIHAKLISQTDIPVCVTGSVTVTFDGDQATGCAAHGLCSYSGTETWEPQGIGDVGVTTIAKDGHRSTNVTLVIGAESTPVLSSVQRAGVGTLAAACSDRAQAQGGFLAALSLHGGRVDVGLDHAQQPIFGTHCAGPLGADLAGALPHRPVSLARLRRGRLTINLGGSAPFAAGGFSGTVYSTVSLALGPPRTQPRHVTAPRSTPTRIATVRYRITHLSGKATTTVRASGTAAVCGPFDACGLQGTISVTPRAASDGSVSLGASAPERRSRRDLLTALGLQRGGDTAGIFVHGVGETTGGAVTADLAQDGNACSNQLALQQTEIVLRKHADRLIVSVSPERSQAADPLRTRCPGPALGRRPLTSASLPLNILRRSRFTVSLHGDSFHDGPYRVTSRSTLTIGLQRRGVTTQIVPFVSARTTG